MGVDKEMELFHLKLQKITFSVSRVEIIYKLKCMQLCKSYTYKAKKARKNAELQLKIKSNSKTAHAHWDKKQNKQSTIIASCTGF